jgi:sugar phosphate isomerase/epimerase
VSRKLGFFSGAVPTWAPADVAAAAKKAGFAAIEWELRPSDGHISFDSAEKDAIARRRESQEHGLEVCCVSASHLVSLLDEQSVDHLVAAAFACGASLARMFAPPFNPSQNVRDQFAAVREALARHAERFDKHGVTLIIELSEETLVPSPELLLRACAGIDSRAVGALYDPANMLVEGNVSPAFAVALLGDYLHHVHMKNEVFLRAADNSWEPSIVPADEGLVDWQVVFAELRRVDYEGWVVIDHLSGEPSLDRISVERSIAEQLWIGASP